MSEWQHTMNRLWVMLTAGNASRSDDDDDEETEDHDTELGNTEAVEGDQHAQRGGPSVKRDPERQPSNLLQVYTAAELALFRKREMTADLTLLEGSPYLVLILLLLNVDVS